MARRRLKGSARAIIAVIVGLVLFFGVRFGMKQGWVPTPGFMKSKVIQSAGELAQNEDEATMVLAGISRLALPSENPARIAGPEVRFEHWFWNAHLACDLANGGPVPTEGSLTAKYGVNLRLVWNDVTPKMQENLVAFATELSQGNPHPRSGAHFVSIMGDQAAGFLGPINRQLRKLGPEYQAEIIYSCGRSNGEDQLMGPASWRSNPQNALGGVVSTVVREGDWNIVVKWARDNKLPVNPDDKTYDPDAINFLNAETNDAAAQKYVTQECESRPVVRNGKPTGETKKVCPDAASVWTPADVAVATGRGGLVRIVSTREYSGQMPVAVIGIRKWNRDNAETVTNMIRAFGEAGDQALAYSEALQRAAEASSSVYRNDRPADWILKYYRGVTERDVQNTLVDLGGSRVHNLADNQRWFGLRSGSSNMFCISYELFGNIVKELYPDFLPEFPPCAEVVNTTYLEAAITASPVTKAETPVFTGGNVRDVISNQTVHIQFRTGSAELTPAATAQLREIMQSAVVANDLAVEIRGHTDNTGTVDGNQSLSEARAFAVKTWLQQQARVDFPDTRFKVRAFGQTQPVASNGTESGRAQNRRVEIVLGRQ